MKLSLSLIISAFALLATIAPVAAPASAEEMVNKDPSNIAIRGYDPVGYFVEGRPIQGKAEFEHTWHDARWRFSTAAHRDMFASSPERYAPRYGGFCAGAMARGRKAPIDPEAWVIIDGRLYLSYAKKFTKEFADNANTKIKQADANWDRMRTQKSKAN